MADVRALLKIKRQEARIEHPLASYNQNGQVRCTACSTIVKHASAWEGHLGSKVHRTNVARLKEVERVREEQGEEERVTRAKRKTEEENFEFVSVDAKKQRAGDPQARSNIVPADFFSDPFHALTLPVSDDSEHEGDDFKTPPTTTTAPSASGLDIEWQEFQRDVLNAPDFQSAYERATVFAEPELTSKTSELFPSKQADSNAIDSSNQFDENQAIKRKEENERELILDRLLDEERAQEEADMKVSLMKSRVYALKKKRESARSPYVQVGDMNNARISI